MSISPFTHARCKAAKLRGIKTGPSPKKPPSQIKIPLFPRYDELRDLLPIWEGWPKNAITHLRTTIGKIRGTP